MPAATLVPLKHFALAAGVPYPHLRRLAADRLFPAVRVGRKLYVHPPDAEAWIAAGGAALPGGWRREPKPGSGAA